MEKGINPIIYQFLLILPIFVIFYLVFLRPQIRQQKKHQEMINNLKKNDEIVTIGGIHGTIVNVKDKTFVIRVDDNVKIEIDKSAIAYVKKYRENDQTK
ncbi:MAG: preprotein translocase subunit YajC [Candidatus Aenigmatarchaeota archaeon]